MEDKRVIRTFGNYPARVFHQKKESLDLGTGVKVIGLTNYEFDQIMFIGNFAKNTANMTKEQIMEWLFGLSINIVFDPAKPKIVTVKGELFLFSDVVMMCLNAKKATLFERYLLKKTKGKEIIYYNYGSKDYGDLGTEIQTVDRAWKIVHYMLSTENYCMLVKIKPQQV
jgi:hypothetical protein